MESTGVYWKPVYYVLEDRFLVWVINAEHLRNVPGRRTNVADSVWITQLIEHGLVSPSFVPPQPIRLLRDLTRHGRRSTEERTRTIGRLEPLVWRGADLVRPDSARCGFGCSGSGGDAGGGPGGNATKLGPEVDLHARHHRRSQGHEMILEDLNLVALVLAAASYYWVERPIIRAGRARLRRSLMIS